MQLNISELFCSSPKSALHYHLQYLRDLPNLVNAMQNMVTFIMIHDPHHWDFILSVRYWNRHIFIKCGIGGEPILNMSERCYHVLPRVTILIYLSFLLGILHLIILILLIIIMNIGNVWKVLQLTISVIIIRTVRRRKSNVKQIL